MAGFSYNFTGFYNGGSFTSSFPQDGVLSNVTTPGGSTFTVGDTIDNPFSGTFAGTFEVDGIVFVALQDPTNSSLYDVYGSVPDLSSFTLPSTLPTLNTAALTVCFLEGTRIATPAGECAVESLAIGDLVLTADGRSVPVKWLGRQRIRNHPVLVSPKMEPVCITAGALGHGLPHTDLYVTAAHGMIWEGLVANAGALVNGSTIRFVPLSEMPETFTWYHIETEGHEEILAHGAPTETFVDYVGRSHFDNHQEYLELYGAERIIPEMKRPRVSSQRMLPDHLRARLGLPAHGAAIAAEANALMQRLRAA